MFRRLLMLCFIFIFCIGHSFAKPVLPSVSVNPIFASQGQSNDDEDKDDDDKDDNKDDSDDKDEDDDRDDNKDDDDNKDEDKVEDDRDSEDDKSDDQDDDKDDKQDDDKDDKQDDDKDDKQDENDSDDKDDREDDIQNDDKDDKQDDSNQENDDRDDNSDHDDDANESREDEEKKDDDKHADDRHYYVGSVSSNDGQSVYVGSSKLKGESRWLEVLKPGSWFEAYGYWEDDDFIATEISILSNTNWSFYRGPAAALGQDLPYQGKTIEVWTENNQLDNIQEATNNENRVWLLAYYDGSQLLSLPNNLPALPNSLDRGWVELKGYFNGQEIIWEQVKSFP